MTTPPAGDGEGELPPVVDELHLLDPETLRRLHGDACVRCGATTGLRPAGYTYTTAGDGTRYGWPVFACADHAPG